MSSPQVPRLRDLITVVAVTRMAVLAFLAMGMALVATPSHADDGRDVTAYADRKRDGDSEELAADDDEDDDSRKGGSRGGNSNSGGGNSNSGGGNSNSGGGNSNSGGGGGNSNSGGGGGNSNSGGGNSNSGGGNSNSGGGNSNSGGGNSNSGGGGGTGNTDTGATGPTPTGGTGNTGVTGDTGDTEVAGTQIDSAPSPDGGLLTPDVAGEQLADRDAAPAAVSGSVPTEVAAGAGLSDRWTAIPGALLAGLLAALAVVARKRRARG